MKTEDETRTAHDILCPVINREMPVELEKESSIYLLGAHDALSWMLNLPAHDQFDGVLADVLKSMKEAGFAFGERRDN